MLRRYTSILRHLRLTLLSLVGVLLVLLACVSALVKTETGSRWVLQRAAQAVPFELGSISGNMLEGLDLGFIDYRQGDLHLRLEEASFRWRPASLLYGAVSIQSLRAARILIELPPAAPAAEPKSPAPPFTAWPNLGLGVRVELGSTQLNNISFRQGDTALDWQSLSGSLSLGTFHLRYSDLAVRHKDYSLDLTGATDLTFPYDTSATLKWRFAPLNGPAGAAYPYEGASQIEGSLRTLRITHRTRLPVVLDIKTQAALVDAHNALRLNPQIQLDAQWRDQQLPEAWWLPKQTPPVTSAHLSAQGNWQQYTAKLDGSLALPHLPVIDLNTQVQGSWRELTQLSLNLRERLPAQIAADAPPVAAQSLAVDGNIAWLPRLDWNLAAAGQHINLANLLEDFPSNLALNLHSDGHLAYGAARSDWLLNVPQVDIAGALRNSNARVKGALALSPRTLETSGLDIIFGANQLQLQGALKEQLDLHWALNAPLLHEVDSHLKGSLTSHGQIQGSIKVPHLTLELAADSLAWGDTALDKLNLSLKPAGSTAAATPVESTSVEPEKVQEAAGISALIGQQVDTEALSEQDYRLSLTGKNLLLANKLIDQIEVTGKGSLQQHLLELAATSAELGRLSFALKGQWDSEQWLGKFDAMTLKFRSLPSWRLTTSAPVRISASELVLENQCFTTRFNASNKVQPSASALSPTASAAAADPLASGPLMTPVDGLNADWVAGVQPLSSKAEPIIPPEFCIAGNWHSASGLTAAAYLKAMPLQQLQGLFRQEVQVNGLVDGDMTLTSKDLSAATTTAEFQLSARAAELSYAQANKAAQVFPLRELGLKAQLEKGLLNAQAEMHWLGYGFVQSKAQLDWANEQIRSANLKASFNNLAPLNVLFDSATDITGTLDADLNLVGSFAKPQIRGAIDLHNGKATLAKAGLNLKNIEVHLGADQSERLELTASLASEKGQLKLEGSLDKPTTSDWQAQAHLAGKDFRLVNNTQLKLNVNPDISLSANGREIRLTGAAHIPWLRANIKSLPPSSTKLSNDVVLVDETSVRRQTSQQLNFYSDVTLSLGKDVVFRGFGLDSKLTGEVSLFKEPERQLFTNGYVKVVEGTYKAYGQALKLERGQLIFQGNYENPGLDLRAYRELKSDEETITVGLELSGTLQRPVAKVFSVPAYSDSDAMMMLITGTKVDKDHKASPGILLGALSGLGGDSTNLTNQLAQALRLDQFEINSDNGIEQSELWIGKYITPKLLVRYIVGIFDQLVTLGAEYQVTERLKIKAESGKTQSVDLIYKVER